MSPIATDGGAIGTTNGSGNASAAAVGTSQLKPGIYVPTIAFFNEDETIDLETTGKHATYLASTGIAGVVSTLR